MPDRAYFISDVHLGVPDGPRDPEAHQDALISFLQHIESGSRLYIVGDLFDFWFEYKSSVPTTGARVIFELYALVKRGIHVSILPGNHDIWLGSYLRDSVGLEILNSPSEVELQGKRVYLMHGDELKDKPTYKFARAVLENPLSIRLFRLLHPDLGVWLGRLTSRGSDGKARVIPRDDRQIYEVAAERLISEGQDVVVFGHYHKGIELEILDGRLVVLGNWVRDDTYGIMEAGVMRLMQWKGDHGEPAPPWKPRLDW